MKLAFIMPVPFIEEAARPLEQLHEKNFKSMVRKGTTIDILWLKTGALEPTYSWTEAFNAIEIVKTAYRAGKKGYDGIVIGCTHDPGLIEARSVIDVPITGVTESSALIACSLGKRFSLICLHEAAAAIIGEKIRRYGLADRLASIRIAGFSSEEALNSIANPQELTSRLTTEIANRAIREDKAEVIIPGCTILSNILTHCQIYEIDGVPLIDPVWAGIKMAETLVDLKDSFGVGVCRRSIYAAPVNWESDILIPED